MPRFYYAIVLAGLLATGCANTVTADTAVMPPGTFASTDADREALYEASQSFGLNATPPTTIQGVARGLADIDYVAGAYNTHARWIGIDGSAQQGMLIARREVRDAVGISQSASSQTVVDALLAVGRAETAPALQQALANSVFSLGPQQTEARLRNLPKFSNTPYAIARLNRASSSPSGSCNNFFC